MNHGSLFSGIGGFDLAAQWMGWNNVFHCEWNDFGRQVLKYHFPKSDSLHDIKQTDFTSYRDRIDVLTGGFPCQPFSTAGKRKGTDDDRYLWSEMFRAVREIRPKYVLGENVRGLTNWNGGLVLDQVCSDLESEGYGVESFILPALAKNAPHRRDRIWICAFRDTPNSTGAGWSKLNTAKESSGQKQFNRSSDPNTNSQLFEQGNDSTQEGWKDERQRAQSLGSNQYQHAITNTERLRSPGKEHRKEESRQHPKANTRSWWKDFPTESPICSGDDGLPRDLDGISFSKWRNETIKAYGNAIVPQVALELFQVIQKIENNELQ